MNLKSLLVSLSLFLIAAFTASPVLAIDIPNFPSCTSPSGSVVVNYNSGIHGIPGDAGQYIGSDIVYTVSDSQLVQCFCAASGAGIQTNWWKDGSLSADQISFLKNLGWIYIADGSAWGLQSTSYLAQNSNYNCAGGQVVPTPTPTPPSAPQPCNGCTGAPSAPVCTAAKPPAPQVTSVVRTGTTAQISWTKVTPATTYAIFYGTTPNNYTFGVPSTGNVTSFVINSLQPGVQYYFKVKAVNDCMPSDDPASPQVLGASTGFGGQVLAATGNSGLILALFSASIVSFAFYFISSRQSRRAK